MKIIDHNVETGEITEIELTAEQETELLAQQTELAWAVLRQTRNHLLTASDWTVLADSPTSTTAWKAYRQQLRDLPANTTDPANPDWPTPPA